MTEVFFRERLAEGENLLIDCGVPALVRPIARYREIACLVSGTHSSSVIVGAAPANRWAQQAETIERAIASLRTD